MVLVSIFSCLFFCVWTSSPVVRDEISARHSAIICSFIHTPSQGEFLFFLGSCNALLCIPFWPCKCGPPHFAPAYLNKFVFSGVVVFCCRASSDVRHEIGFVQQTCIRIVIFTIAHLSLMQPFLAYSCAAFGENRVSQKDQSREKIQI